MAWSNAAMLDTLLFGSTIVMILASIGGGPGYNVALPLYLSLGLYMRIPRALLGGLVAMAVSVVADICWLGIFGHAIFETLHSDGPNVITSSGGFASVMIILNMFVKVPIAWYGYKCFTEMGGLWSTAAGTDAQPASEEYYGMAGADANAANFAGAAPTDAYQKDAAQDMV